MDRTASEIVDEKGGPAVFAAEIGHRAGAVRQWKHRNRFPRDAWPEIIKAYPDLTLDRLLEIERRSDPASEIAKSLHIEGARA